MRYGRAHRAVWRVHDEIARLKEFKKELHEVNVHDSDLVKLQKKLNDIASKVYEKIREGK